MTDHPFQKGLLFSYFLLIYQFKISPVLSPPANCDVFGFLIGSDATFYPGTPCGVACWLVRCTRKTTHGVHVVVMAANHKSG